MDVGFRWRIELFDVDQRFVVIRLILRQLTLVRLLRDYRYFSNRLLKKTAKSISNFSS